MTKIQPKIRDINDPIYDTPIFGPTIAWIDGLFIRIICVGALKIVQTPVEVVTYAFDVQNATIIDYDAVILSGVELVWHKTVGGVVNQIKGLYGSGFDITLGTQDLAGDLQNDEI
ncbi:MAG: hypothetical protein KBC27_00030 [Rickettsiales bacterium]|nr:hypothetical protein [Rickettsiales bacterium]